jgi:cytochrome c oxidase subunit 2
VTNDLYFRPRRTGTFENGVCGEFCGIQHARMTTRVAVLEGSGYNAWLRQNAPGGGDAVALGEGEWRAACAKCHGVEGEGDIGPPIARNPTLTNFEALRTLLYEGQDNEGTEGYMPPVGLGWTDEQIRALVAYVESNETLGGEQDGR